MVCRLSAKPEGDSPQPAENIIGCGLESLKGIPPGKVCFRPFREFVCIGEDFTKYAEGVRDERPRSR